MVENSTLTIDVFLVEEEVVLDRANGDRNKLNKIGRIHTTNFIPFAFFLFRGKMRELRSYAVELIAKN